MACATASSSTSSWRARPSLDPEALRSFLDRLDGLMVAIEGYANPELALDVLLLAWPRSRALAASPDARTTAPPAAPPAAS